MRRVSCVVSRLAVIACLGLSLPVLADSRFRAPLTGFDQVPPVLTQGRGSVRLVLDAQSGQLDYELRLTGLEGQATGATIHFGQPSVNGGAMAFLCLTPIFLPHPSGDSFPFPPVPACPDGPDGIVLGSISRERVFGPPEQGVDFGNFDGLVRALASGRTYVNITTTAFETGELRGQIRAAGSGGSSIFDRSFDCVRRLIRARRPAFFLDGVSHTDNGDGTATLALTFCPTCSLSFPPCQAPCEIELVTLDLETGEVTCP